MAVVGALTMFLHSCDGTRPEGPTVICTGEDMHPVKPGETLTGILRTEAAKGRLSRTELHLAARAVSDHWEAVGTREDITDLSIDPKAAAAFNITTVAELRAGETVAIPDECFVVNGDNAGTS